jgi:hypothetical protein
MLTDALNSYISKLVDVGLHKVWSLDEGAVELAICRDHSAVNHFC